MDFSAAGRGRSNGFRTGISPGAGFTLIELLVVFAIGICLLALLIPGFQRLRIESSMSASANNMRQLGSGMMLYAADNRGTLPPTHTETRNASDTGWIAVYSWDVQVLSYLGAEIPNLRNFNPKRPDHSDAIRPFAKITVHPADNVRRVLYDGGADTFLRSYAMAGASGGVGRGNSSSQGSTTVVYSLPLQSVPEPSKSLLLVERLGFRSDRGFIGRTGFAVVRRPSDQIHPTYPLASRMPRLNYLFVDGHVERLAPEDTIGSGTMNAPRGYWVVNPENR